MHGFNDSSLSSFGRSDQADGLRRLFAGSRQRLVPVASNPHARYSGVMLERLVAAFSACGVRTLIVDAAETAPEPSEMAMIELAACVESILPDTAYMAARGLPLRFVDARGSTGSFLEALADAAPQYEVVLLHASAPDLARLCVQRSVRPVLLAEEQPESVTHAYASMKLLAQRCELKVFDLMMASPAASAFSQKVVDRMATCADSFLGTVLHECVRVDPAQTAATAPSPWLCRMAASQLNIDETGSESPAWYVDAPSVAAKSNRFSA